jgi:hypothetical protein
LWKLVTASEENKNGSWHGWQISKDSVVKDPSIYAEARLFAETIGKGQVNVKHVQEDEGLSDQDVPF